MIASRQFYGVYHGHDIEHLNAVFEALVARPRASGRDVRVVFLAGDSSLDNKYWIDGTQPASNGMEHVLTPPRSVPDVAAQLNTVLQQQHDSRGSGGAAQSVQAQCPHR